MDIGTGIAVGSAIIGAVAIIFKLFQKETHCPDHSGVCAKQESFDAWLNKIEAKLDRVIQGKVAAE